MKTKLMGILVLLLAAFSGIGSAVEPELTFRFVHTHHPSSFPPLLWIHVRNPSYMAFELANEMAASMLVVDGISFPRTETTFAGPPGLAAQGEWEGCLPLADYASPINLGKHRVSMKIGRTSSNEETIRWTEPLNWRQGNVKTREKEVREAAAALKAGVPRTCVEQWLTVQDGGPHESRQVRYYLEPFFKVVVPYSEPGPQGRQGEAVSGRAKVYQENRVY